MEYWTIIENRHAGPYTVEQLVEMGILPDAPVWHEGLPDWVRASEVPEIVEAINAKYNLGPQASAGNAAQTAETGYTEQQYAPEEQECHEPQEAPGEQQGPYEPQQPENFEPTSGFAPRPEQQYAQQTYQGPQQAPYEPQGQPVPGPGEYQTYNGPAQYVSYEGCPPTYLVWSIIVTLLCCTLPGIVAIIFSAQVKSAWRRGDAKKAEKWSERAQWMIILSIVLGVIYLPFQIAFLPFTGA